MQKELMLKQWGGVLITITCISDGQILKKVLGPILELGDWNIEPELLVLFDKSEEGKTIPLWIGFTPPPWA